MINPIGKETSANSAARYRGLDGYRFIAASLIVLFHFNSDFELGLERSTPIVNSLSVMVDFFFVLSGFVIAASYGGAMKSLADYTLFLRRRLARIGPLHLAVLALFVLPAVALAFGLVRAQHPDAFSLGALPAHVLLLQAWGAVNHEAFNGPSWSISAEWLAYLLFPALLMLSRRLSATANLRHGVCAGAVAQWRAVALVRGDLRLRRLARAADILSRHRSGRSACIFAAVVPIVLAGRAPAFPACVDHAAFRTAA